MARAVADAMIRTMPSTHPALVTGVATSVNLMANPLMLSSGTDPTSSIARINTGTGASATRSMVADTSGQLPYGQWTQVDLDATSGQGAFGRDFVINAGLWTIGDTLGICSLMQIDDVTGGGAWDAACSAGTAQVQADVTKANDLTNLRASTFRCAGRVIGANKYQIGPIWTTLVIPSGLTGMYLTYWMKAPAGLHITARWGVFGVYNLTTLGVDGGGTAMQYFNP
jgi:hypothetical protein